jgi:hypothetical protein
MHLPKVWYSAAWSSSTLSAFRSALTLLLAEPVVGGVRLAPEVVRLLRHWQVSVVCEEGITIVWVM